jgi:hypothetical protein
MYIVKLTFNYEWLLFRQTPGNSGIWGDYRFVIDPELNECDYWIIYTEHGLTKESCKCNPDNIVFLPAEGFQTSEKYPHGFLKQFAHILTVQREIKGKNVMYGQSANPWFIEKDYDELVKMQVPGKTKLISVISSNKAFTEGHRKRVKFVQNLKKHFGDRIDVFGRGINDFEKKWDVTAPYKFQIAIENDNCQDWVTEKFFDPLLTFTYPIYYGCPNLADYIDEKSFTRIDINKFDEAVSIIEQLLKDTLAYDEFMASCKRYSRIYLNELQFFPLLSSILVKISGDVSLKKKVVIYGLEAFKQNKHLYLLKKYIKKLIGGVQTKY